MKYRAYSQAVDHTGMKTLDEQIKEFDKKDLGGIALAIGAPFEARNILEARKINMDYFDSKTNRDTGNMYGPDKFLLYKNPLGSHEPSWIMKIVRIEF